MSQEQAVAVVASGRPRWRLLHRLYYIMLIREQDAKSSKCRCSNNTHTHSLSHQWFTKQGAQQKQSTCVKSGRSEIKEQLAQAICTICTQKAKSLKHRLQLRGSSIIAGNAVQGAGGEEKKKVNMTGYPQSHP